MKARDEALASLEGRLQQASQTDDATALFTQKALAEASVLVRCADSDDLHAAHTLGWFHWFRYRTRPEPEDRRDLDAAVGFFGPVYRDQPHTVPDELHLLLTDDASGNTRAAANLHAASLLQAYERTAYMPLLEQAIALLGEALQATPAGHPDRGMYLNNLGLALYKQFERVGNLAVLEEGVECCRQAVAAAPTDHPYRGLYLNALGNGLRKVFEHVGDTTALEEAVQVLRQGVAAAPTGHPDRSYSLGSLCLALLALFERFKDTAVLDEAVQVGREAVAAAPADHPHWAKILNNLGLVLNAQFERFGDRAVLAEAVQVRRDAVAATPIDDPGRASFLSNLGNDLGTLYKQVGETSLLVEAVQALRQSEAGHPDRVLYLSSLLHALLAQFKRFEDSAVLAEAVQVGRVAVEVTPADHPDRAKTLDNLGLVLKAQFERFGDTAVLAEAVQVSRDAVAATPADHPNQAIYLNNFGVALYAQFERFGDTAVLAEAVQVSREAVAVISADHPNRAAYLNNLGSALQSQFERFGDTAVLAEAVNVKRQAVTAILSDHPNRARYLTSLGTALQVQFERIGDTEMLQEAIRFKREAVSATSTDHPDRAAILNNLGIGLHALFERVGDTAALEEALLVEREAVAATPSDHPDLAARLSNLAQTLRTMFERFGDISALAEAVSVAQDAVQATPSDHSNRAAVLNGLGLLLQDQFEQVEDTAILEAAVQVGRDAVAATPADHPYRATNLNGLGRALRTMFKHLGDVAALEEAIEIQRQAVVAIPADHPNRSSLLNSLGYSLLALHLRTDDAALRRESLDCFQSASRTLTATALDRLRALRKFAEMTLADPALIPQAVAAVETAVALLPQISPRTLGRADREYQIGLFGSVATVAVATTLEAGDPQRAVELLEACRGILVADPLDARDSDLTRLRETWPRLEQEFRHLRDLLQHLERPQVAPGVLNSFPAGRAFHEEDAAELTRQRVATQAAWDRLLGQIRDLNGFDTFLGVPGISDLASQAEPGPVVFLMAGPTRCDALILTNDREQPVKVVRLSQLTEDDVVSRATQLLVAQQAGRDRDLEPAAGEHGKPNVLDILGWLWDMVAEPILSALGLTGAPAPGEPWPRVWWCPVGVMAYLPVHAAGHHRDITSDALADRNGPRTVMDRVVSTYIPTVRALAHARGGPPVLTEPALIVAVPNAPGANPLPGVEAEANFLTALLPGAFRMDHPERDGVLAALPDHPVAHFACHGKADWADPGTSRLILNDHQTRPLTVGDINGLRLSGALAFLSACETASTRLVDEAVHLTGAFHLAGYQNVIGTLWRVDDLPAARIAAGVYARLTDGGATPPVAGLSALALHETIRDLRTEYPDTPTWWAAHIHTGI